MPRLSFDRYLAPNEGETGAAQPVSAVPVRLRAVEEDVRRLPPLPAMMTELLHEMGSVDADITILEERISRDPTLTTRLLRMANSAFYAPAADVCSVGQALMILGLRTARNLVLATAMRAVMGRGQRSAPGMKTGGIFQHSVAVGIIAVRLGRGLGKFEQFDQSLFVAGLLHDIGMVALAETYSDRHAALGRRPDTERERDVIGIDHLHVGRMVHEHWNLPAELLGPITRHHAEPEALADDPLTALVALADAHADLAGHCVYEADGDDEEPYHRREAFAAMLGIDQHRIDDKLANLDREITSFMGSLR